MADGTCGRSPPSGSARTAARRAFLRVRLVTEGDAIRAEPAGGQQSSQLRPLADANALLIVPEGVAAAEPGVPYEAIVLEPLNLVQT